MAKRLIITDENILDARTWLINKLGKEGFNFKIDIERLKDCEYVDSLVVNQLTPRETNLLSRAISAAKARRQKKSPGTQMASVQLPRDLVEEWVTVAELVGVPKSEILRRAIASFLQGFQSEQMANPSDVCQ